MHWFFYMLLIGSAAYVGYMLYLMNKRAKRLRRPKCEKCGSPMILKTRVDDEEIWECPVCSEKKGDKDEL